MFLNNSTVRLNIPSLYEKYLLNEHSQEDENQIAQFYDDFLHSPHDELTLDEKKLLILYYLRKHISLSSTVNTELNLEKGSSIGPYRILETTPPGKVGEFYICFHPETKTIMGIKKLKSDLIKEEIGAFLLETIRALQIGSLDLDNLHGMHYFFTDQHGNYYGETDYIPGVLLGVTHYREYTPEILASIIYHIAYSLYCYSQPAQLFGIADEPFHGDLHGNNIIIRYDGIPVIIDWGQSSLKRCRSKSYPITAPELLNPTFLHNAAITSKVDVWAVGVTLFKLLTNEYPYHAEHHGTDYIVDTTAYSEHYANPMTENDPRLQKIDREYQPLIALILSMITIDPEKRPTFQEIIESLEKQYKHNIITPTFKPIFDAKNLEQKLEMKERQINSLIRILVYHQKDIKDYLKHKQAHFDYHRTIVERYALNAFHEIRTRRPFSDKITHLGLALFSGELEIDDDMNFAWRLFLELHNMSSVLGQITQQNSDILEDLYDFAMACRLCAQKQFHQVTPCFERIEINAFAAVTLMPNLEALASFYHSYGEDWALQCYKTLLERIGFKKYSKSRMIDLIDYMKGAVQNTFQDLEKHNAYSKEDKTFSNKEIAKIKSEVGKAIFFIKFVEYLSEHTDLIDQIRLLPWFWMRSSFSTFALRFHQALTPIIPANMRSPLLVLNDMEHFVKAHRQKFIKGKGEDEIFSMYCATLFYLIHLIPNHEIKARSQDLSIIIQNAAKASLDAFSRERNMWRIVGVRDHFIEKIYATEGTIRDEYYRLFKTFLSSFGTMIYTLERDMLDFMPQSIDEGIKLIFSLSPKGIRRIFSSSAKSLDTFNAQQLHTLEATSFFLITFAYPAPPFQSIYSDVKRILMHAKTSPYYQLYQVILLTRSSLFDDTPFDQRRDLFAYLEALDTEEFVESLLHTSRCCLKQTLNWLIHLVCVSAANIYNMSQDIAQLMAYFDKLHRTLLALSKRQNEFLINVNLDEYDWNVFGAFESGLTRFKYTKLAYLIVGNAWTSMGKKVYLDGIRNMRNAFLYAQYIGNPYEYGNISDAFFILSVNFKKPFDALVAMDEGIKRRRKLAGEQYENPLKRLIIADIEGNMQWLDISSLRDEELNRFGMISVNVGTLGNAGIIAKNTGNYERSLALLSEAILLNPYDPRLYNSCGNVYKHLARYNQAIENFQKALHLMDNAYLEAWFNLGDMYCRRFAADSKYATSDEMKRIFDCLLHCLEIDPNEADTLRAFDTMFHNILPAWKINNIVDTELMELINKCYHLVTFK